MNNPIAKTAIILLLIFFQCHGVVAQSGVNDNLLKRKAVSTLAADQKKTPTKAKTAEVKPETEDATVTADTVTAAAAADTLDLDMTAEADSLLLPEESTGFHQTIKTKFIEGNAFFMSLVALALVLGLALCIERIIYLTLSEINAKKLIADISRRVEEGDIEGARTLCQEARGPVAAICDRALAHVSDSIEDIERGITSYGSVQAANLENGCSWITLFIAMTPSLGFLGTVIGMVMAFEQIQMAGDISPTIVASGMKVSLLTTIFGLISALILQVFYNFILSKIEHIVSQMEESAISLLEILLKYKQKR